MNPQHCVGCPYRKTGLASHTGPADATLVIVGEAPGRNEVRTGEPFIGDAGKLLDRALDLAGIDRAQAFITNAMQCRPTDSPPREDAIRACQSRLWEELAQHDRAVIIALGNSAMRSILDDFTLKITTQRGKCFDDALGRVVPTFHPASVLRNRGEWPRFVADIRYAGALHGGGTAKSPGTVEWTLVNERNVRNVVERLALNARVAVDVETSTYHPDDEWGGRPGFAINLGVAYAKNKAYAFDLDPRHDDNILTSSRGREALAAFFDSATEFIWHNGKFDVTWFRRMGFNARVDHDTMLMHYALDESKGGHGLEPLGQDWLGADDWKAKLRRDFPAAKDSFANIPHPAIDQYVATDADATLQLFLEFYPQLQKSKALTKLYTHLLIPASEFLYGVEQRGLWLDLAYLDTLTVVLEQQAETAYDEMVETLEGIWDADLYLAQSPPTKGKKKAPKFFNPASTKQLHWVLRRVYGRGIRIADTQEKTLLELPPRPFIRSLLAYREATKLMSTFGEGLRKRVRPDGRIHSTYFLHGTETGRLSSRDPNLQNIPATPRTRNIFAAPARKTFIELDYSQAELRLLAHFSQDPFLIGIYTDGKRNLHDEVAKAMFGEGYTYEQKMRAKALNFGIAYGRSAHSLALEFHIGEGEAEEMRQAWFARMPEARRFIDSCRAKAVTGRTIVTPFGRRRRFGVITRDNRNNLENEAANFPMQSTASDLTLYSAMRMQEVFDHGDFEFNLGKAGVVNLVHDSVLIECDETWAESIAEVAQYYMEATPRIVLKSVIPFKVDVHIGPKWGDLKS